jgi:hypothetical protein
MNSLLSAEFIYRVTFSLDAQFIPESLIAFRGIDNHCPHGRWVDWTPTFPLETSLNVQASEVRGFICAWPRLYAAAELARETARAWDGILLGPVWLEREKDHTHNVPGDDALVLRHGKEASELLEVWTTIKVPYRREASIVREYPRPCEVCGITVPAPVPLRPGSDEPRDDTDDIRAVEFRVVIPPLPGDGRVGLFRIAGLYDDIYCTDAFRQWALSLEEPRGLRFIKAGYQA